MEMSAARALTVTSQEGTANQNGTVHGGAVFAILDSLVNTAVSIPMIEIQFSQYPVQGYYTLGFQTATASGRISRK